VHVSVEEMVKDVGGMVKDVKPTVDTTLVAVRQGGAGTQASVGAVVAQVKGTVEETVATVQRTVDLPSQMEPHPWPMVGGAVLAGYRLSSWGGGHSSAAGPTAERATEASRSGSPPRLAGVVRSSSAAAEERQRPTGAVSGRNSRPHKRRGGSRDAHTACDVPARPADAGPPHQERDDEGERAPQREPRAAAGLHVQCLSKRGTAIERQAREAAAGNAAGRQMRVWTSPRTLITHANGPLRESLSQGARRKTMHKAALLFSLSLFVCGGYAGTAHAAESTPAPPAQMAPDNTGRNVRDRGDVTLTPGDQSERKAERTLTQRIRQAVVADKSLSTTAKNVKIITVNGVVTLRGPVNSLQEKGNIEATAQRLAGTTKVDNQLEIIRH
ncbi:MAG TPA: BON domain-containing protein, partial [Candidatus Saccharimonadia bacterium]|nr:BON domain-containing protein [Candidatus Saccharimonadia bacterium]